MFHLRGDRIPGLQGATFVPWIAAESLRSTVRDECLNIAALQRAVQGIKRNHLADEHELDLKHSVIRKPGIKGNRFHRHANLSRCPRTQLPC